MAGLGPRLTARIFDIVAVLLLNVIANGWFAYQWVLEFAPVYQAAVEAQSFRAQTEASPRMSTLTWIILFVATAVWLAYEVPAIGGTGQTLGKRIMRIRVVGVDSTKPIGLGRAFRRWARLGIWTPAWTCFGIGLLFQLMDSASPLLDRTLRQAWHDKTANTVVVEAMAPPRHSAHGAPAGDGRTDNRAGGKR